MQKTGGIVSLVECLPNVRHTPVKSLHYINQEQEHVPVVPALGKGYRSEVLSLDVRGFEASLAYVGPVSGRRCLMASLMP